MRLLLARVRAMTRSQRVQNDVLLQAGNITLNCASLEVSAAYGSFHLPNKEYQMLEMLLRTQSGLIPAERFWEVIWGFDSDVKINVVWESEWLRDIQLEKRLSPPTKEKPEPPAVMDALC